MLNRRLSASSHRSRNLSVVLAALGVGLIGVGFVSPATKGVGATGLSGTVTGTIFRDYNGSGAKDDLEPGQDGIEVRAFDSAGSPLGAVATSGADGSYTLAVPHPNDTPVRIEFTIPAALSYLKSGPAGDGHGVSSGTAVQFSTVGKRADFGVWNPAEYCQSNPTLVLACHTFGDAVNGFSNNAGQLKTYPSTAAGSPFDKTNTTTAATLATNKQTGTTFGLAYNRSTKEVYSASFQRVYAGFGPGGPGAVYRVTEAGAVSVLAIIPNAGDDVRKDYAPNLTVPTGEWLSDPTWDKVGKMSLGGLALTDDESTAWVVNLNDRSLYPITVADGSVGAPVAIPHAIPLATGASTACAANDVRPFALTAHDGKLFVGETCTAESSSAKDGLAMSIYSFDPVTKTFSLASVFSSAFDQTHGQPGNGCNHDSGAWNPWTPTDMFNNPASHTCAYPQPWLSGIAFDHGNLVLGIRDRFGDQSGVGHPVGGEGVAAGDVLRACGSLTAGWTMESNGSCGGVKGSGVGNKQGPGGGEYYAFDHFADGTNHEEAAVGSVLQLAGSPDVIYTVYDPSLTNANDWRAGGTHTDANATGKNTRWFEVYDKCDATGENCPAGRAASGYFGKANSLGEVEALCDKAPLELGNRVWMDTNANGLQDANESGIAGVTLDLFEGSTPVGTTKSAPDGTYLFNAKNVATGIKPATVYTIRLDNPADSAANGPLNGLGLSAANSGDNRSIDSNSNDVRGTPTIAVKTGSAGSNDHTLDVGFSPSYALGNRVFKDLDNSGTLTPTDGQNPGIGGVTLELFRSGEVTALATTSTDPNGYYCFSHLSAGQYVIAVAAGNFGGPLAGLTSSTGAGQEADPNADIDNNDNGIDGAGAIRTGVIALGSTEPLAEADVNPSCAGTPDSHSNLTIDFGFYGAAALGNYVWIDTNHDGLQNEPAANGVNGVTVIVTDAVGKVVGTAVTANNPDGGAPGYYHVTNLAPGTYKVTFTTLPLGFAPTTTAAGTDRAVDSDGAVTGTVTIAAGDDNLTLDLGLFAPTAVGDFTWLDANRNGIFDAGEAPLGGVVVTLLDSNGQPVATDADGQPVTAQVTTPDGRYLFGNLRPGIYQVRFTPPAGYQLTTEKQGSDPTIDSNGPLATSANLQAGQQDLTLDAGFVPLLASLGDRVWIDSNENGVQDADERGVSGVVVLLLDAAGKQLASTTTDVNGIYIFTDLAPGTYVVQFVAPVTMQFTKPLQGAAATDSNADVHTGRTAPITLIGGQDDPTIDAGLFVKPNVAPQTVSTTIPAAIPGALPRTGSNPYRMVEAAGLLAELGAIFLFVDSRRKRLA